MKRHAIILPAVFLLVLGRAAHAEVWHVPGDFTSIQEAIDDTSVIDGDTILVGPGYFAGALLTKSVEIKGLGGAIIDSGPLHSSGLIQGFRLLDGSGGTTLSQLTFTVDLAIMNGAAVDDVTVTQCTFYDAVQAVSNWRGSRWDISHNKIIDLRTRCGGGIGILVADYTGGEVMANVVAHNDISGTLHVSAGDCGGYNGTGIVLYADFRWGAAGALAIQGNRVVKNKVSLVSNDSDVVDVVAIELTDTRDDSGADPFPVIFDNAIGFNDLRGTDLTIEMTPDGLADYNDISRNLGADPNRGHGLHPVVFGPGGN